MFDKATKKEINERLKGVPNKGQVFNLINQGGNIEQVNALIQKLIEDNRVPDKIEIWLRDFPAKTRIFGQHLVDANAVRDIEAIAKLSPVIATAGMPDMHRTMEGSVPVGGVILMDAVDPQIVSADIACSVMFTVTSLEVTPDFFDVYAETLRHVLRNFTHFGADINPTDIGLKADFYINRPRASQMKTAAGREALEAAEKRVRAAFGTSGDGNHFMEMGISDVTMKGKKWVRSGKKYFALLSHFGSRGVGAVIAKVFIAAAAELYKVPNGIHSSPLAWGSPLAQDYWKLMQFAGDMAEAGHEWVHKNVLVEMYRRKLINNLGDEHSIYSRHNFAWETLHGIVHRKGATPAMAGEYGVIPATMGHATQIVMGLGNPESFNSASHGAGRTHSRGAALQAFKGNTKDYVAREFGIDLIGGGPDEDPRAYKDIDAVMAAQSDCVASIGTFKPKVVRMADPRFNWR